MFHAHGKYISPGVIVPVMIPGTICARELADGSVLAVVPLIFGRARLTLGPDDVSIEKHW